MPSEAKPKGWTPERKWARRRIIVNARVQTRLLTPVLFFALALAVLVGLLFFLPVSRQIRSEPNLVVQVILKQHLLELALRLGAIVLLTAAVSALYALWLSHRMAGPMYRLARTLEQMAQGKYDPTPFRAGDYFREFEALTRLVAKKMEVMGARNRDLLTSTEKRVHLLSSRLDGEVIPKWELKEALDGIVEHIRQASPELPKQEKTTGHSRSAGFTLIELLIVTVIILILSVIALPYFLEAKQRAHEAAAVGLLRTVSMAQIQYHFQNAQYADSFDALAEYGMADINLTRGGGGDGEDLLLNSSYIFRLSRPMPSQWTCTGEPAGARNTARYFYVDDGSVIRFAVGAYATPDSKPI